MSVLETIRKRAGVFVVIAIGASMMIFILEDALTSGRFFFGGNENSVAMAGNKKIDYQALNSKIEEILNIEKVGRGSEALDEQTRNQTVQNEYQQMVANMILEPQCKKLGISLPDSELTDLLLGAHHAPEVQQFFTDHQTGQISKEFVDPRTGGLNMAVVVQFVKQLSDQDPRTVQYLADWTLLEYQVKDRQLQSKYFDLIKNGLFVTDAEAKQAFEDQNKYYNISYVLKKYSDVADNSVAVNDQDIQAYYNQHMYEYNQTEESRKIDYVSFYAAPTEKDLSELKRQVDSLASNFRTLKPADDSAFIVAESDEHFFDNHYHKHGQLEQDIDSILSGADKGFIYGPYKDNQEYRIVKVLDVAQLPDSAKVHLIVLPAVNNDFTKAKILADSLKSVITPANFAELAQKYSQDATAQKGGDIGWVQQGKVGEDIEQACFFGNKGDIKEVKTQGAYVLFWAEDQSPKEKYLKTGVVTKKIGPSTETTQSVFAQASAFSGKHSATDAFESASEQMNKRVIDIKENDPTIAGMQTPKELLRWAYQAKNGEVSGVFDVGGDRFVVAHLVQITPMGTTPLPIVKDIVKQKALQEKKAQKLIADLKSQMQGVNNIAALGQKAGVPAQRAQRLLFQTYNVPGLGKEDALLGVMSGLKPQTLSQPFEGQQGVYVIQVDSVFSPAAANYRMAQFQRQETMRNRVQYDAFDALERKAGLVSHFGKFF